jgi:hypothetical protein
MNAQHQDGEGPRAGAHDAHDAHPHEAEGEWGSPLGLDENFVQNFFTEWQNAEEQIASYNNVKKAMLSRTRALYGSYHTEALKRACNLALKDKAIVCRDLVIDKAARKLLDILWKRN